jgi:hypothetical protein
MSVRHRARFDDEVWTAPPTGVLALVPPASQRAESGDDGSGELAHRDGPIPEPLANEWRIVRLRAGATTLPDTARVHQIHSVNGF